MSKKVIDIQKLLGPSCKIIGDSQREFHDVKPIHEASFSSLTFCSKKNAEAISIIEKSKASVIICDVDVLSSKVAFDDKTLVVTTNPRLAIMRCINAFFPSPIRTGIHPTAIFGKNCQISDDVYIGPYVCIGDGVIIGSRTEIHSNVNISDRVRIGKNVRIKSGCSIGFDGFGYEKNEEGVFVRFPHRGSVIIDDNVEIGANTCIDRGVLSDTVIGHGTKIDNLVHIAHNVIIGQNCIIVTLSCIAGSARICDGAWVAPCACVRDGVVVGKNALVGMGAVVTKDVMDNDVVMGVPARSMKNVPQINEEK